VGSKPTISRRCPTEKQYDTLRALGAGSAGLSFTKRSAEPLLRRGWVTAEFHDPYYQWVRITADGLRALADAVEKYGLPEIGPKPQKWQSYCGKCHSTRIHTRMIDVDIPQPVAA
jgi:hypothetical protein